MLKACISKKILKLLQRYWAKIVENSMINNIFEHVLIYTQPFEELIS